MVPKYRYRGTFSEKYSVFSIVIPYQLKIELFFSLWSGANKFLTPKYNKKTKMMNSFVYEKMQQTVKANVVKLVTREVGSERCF